MRKILNVLLAVLITLFSFPIHSLNVSAEEKVYEDIADGEHEIKVELLTKGTDETSIAQQYINEVAKLNVQDGNAELVIEIPKVEGFEFKEFSIEGYEFDKTEAADSDYYHFKLNEVKSKLASVVTYSVNTPYLDFEHEDIEMDVKLIGLDELPKIEKEEEPEDKRVVGELISEDEADEVYTVNFETDSRATKGQLENPTKLLVKDGKKYIQIRVKDSGAQFFRSLKFNGEDVKWNNLEEAPFIVQAELEDGIDSEIDVFMEIFTGKDLMPHDGIKLWFDKDTLKQIKETEKDGSDDQSSEDKDEPGEDSGDKGTDGNEPGEDPKDGDSNDGDSDKEKEDDITIIEPGKAYEVDYTLFNRDKSDKSLANGLFAKPGVLLEKDGNTYLQLTVNNGASIKSLKNEFGDYIYVGNNGSAKIIQIRVPNNLSDMELEVFVEVEGLFYDNYDVVLTINQDSMKEVKAKDYKVIPSTSKNNQNGPYDPKATVPKEPGKKNEPKTTIQPDRAYTIDYTILNENGKDKSVADSFFAKPGLLLEKDGKKYLQMSINNGDMVKSLSNKYGDALYVKSEGTSDTFQIRVEDDLSDMTLDMHISVPGLYNEKHTAILTFDKDSKAEIDLDEYKVIPSTDKDNQNGPYNPDANLPGEGEDPKEDPKEVKPDKAYEIDYVIYKEDVDQVSVADEFFQKPGLLLEKDGEQYLQVTIDNWSMIEYLQYNGKHVLVFDQDKSKDQAKVQLKIDGDLTDVIPLTMKINVPGLYSEEHKARLVLFPETMKEVSTEGHYIYLDSVVDGHAEGNGENGENGSNGGEGNSDDTPEKPELGESGGNGDQNGKGKPNPKTGDKSQIIIFSTLLLASLAVLVYQVRRRLVAQ